MDLQGAWDKAVEALDVANDAKTAADNAATAAGNAVTAAGNAAAVANNALLTATGAESAISSINQNLDLANPTSIVRALQDKIDELRAQVQARIDATVSDLDGLIRQLLGDVNDLKDKVVGERDTLEGWCFPVLGTSTTLPNLADHTFVYCPERKSYFNCWALSGDIAFDDTEQVCSGRARGAFCKADRYRIPVMTPLGMRPDTAGLGSYGVNGVCHQSTNLFLYAVDRILPLTSPSGRPRGVLASYVLYGPYGTVTPGAPSGNEAHLARWYRQVYEPAAAACDAAAMVRVGSAAGRAAFSSAAAPGTGPGLAGGEHKLSMRSAASRVATILKERLAGVDEGVRARMAAEIEEALLNEWEARVSDEMIVQQSAGELNSLLAQYIPDLSTGSMQETHASILRQKNRILIENGFEYEAIANGRHPRMSGSDCDTMIEKLNELSLAYQSELLATIGHDAYIRINGDRQYYRPIDPSIARSVLARFPAQAARYPAGRGGDR